MAASGKTVPTGPVLPAERPGAADTVPRVEAPDTAQLPAAAVPTRLGEPDTERTDLRLLPAGLAAWAAGWWAPTMSPGATVIAIAVATVVAGAATATAVLARAGTAAVTVRHLWVAAAALLVAAAVLAVATLGTARASASIVDELAEQRAVVTAQLRITSDARVVQAQGGPPTAPPLRLLRAVIEDVAGRGQRAPASAPVVVLASDAGWDSLIPSSLVRATGRLAPNDRVSREVAVLRVVGAPKIVVAPSTVQRVAEHLRSGLRTAASGLPQDPRGLLPGLVVGDESLMPADLLDDAKATGLTHLTAVSGANVAIVLAVVLAVARWCGVRAWLVPAAGAGALAGFVVLARPDPSVLRATVMGLVVILGMASGSRRRRVSGLCAAVVVLVLVDPWLSRSYGFALSVLASAGIVLLVPGWTDRWSRWLPRPLAAALAVPVAAQLVCAPVVVLLSDTVSVVAVVANLVAAPAVAPATVLGVVVAVIAPVAPLPAALVAHVAGVPAAWIAGVARWFADRPFAVVDWPGDTRGALALAGVTIAAVVTLPVLIRRPHVLTAVVVAALALWGVRATGAGWPQPGWQLVACDVGQGDALVLPVSPGSAVVVDTGPEPALVDACLRRLGVDDVPLVLLTHGHADHIGGLLGVLAGRHVQSIAIGPGGSLGMATDELATALERSGADVLTLAAGWSGAVGALRLEVLWPPADPAAMLRLDPAESAENNASLVTRLLLPAGPSVLLTGDIEPSAQRALVRSGVDFRADVLKVPHHGSRYQDAAFLEQVGASAAVVSVGAGNDYGHPSTVTIELLERAGTRVFRTDTAGAISVAGTADRLEVAATRAGFVAALLPAGRADVGGSWQAGRRWSPRAPLREQCQARVSCWRRWSWSWVRRSCWRSGPSRPSRPRFARPGQRRRWRSWTA